MDPSETGDSSNPLADITNTINQGSHVVLDPTERKRQRNKEPYASLSREQKDELNRKARERRAEKKKRDQASLHDEGGDGQFNGGHITIEGGNTCGDNVSIQAEKESPHKPDGDGLFNFRHVRIEDNDNGAEDPITPELQGGTNYTNWPSIY